MDVLDELGESRIGPQFFQPRVDTHKSESYCVFVFRLSQPFKGIVKLVEIGKDDGDLIG
jgi:hypothetical protein